MVTSMTFATMDEDGDGLQHLNVVLKVSRPLLQIAACAGLHAPPGALAGPGSWAARLSPGTEPRRLVGVVA